MRGDAVLRSKHASDCPDFFSNAESMAFDLQGRPMASEFESAGYSAEQLKELKLDPRDFLGAIIASSDDAIISKTLDGTIISWNSAARRIFGYRAEEIMGLSILTLIPPELHYEEENILRRLGAGERIEHFETIRLRKNGERFPISVTISPIKDETGTVIGASKIARDISDKLCGSQK